MKIRFISGVEAHLIVFNPTKRIDLLYTIVVEKNSLQMMQFSNICFVFRSKI